MSYYQVNKKKILQKTKEKYDNGGGKEKAAEYYESNKDILREKAKIGTEICEKKRKKQKGNIQKIGTIKGKRMQIYFAHE